MTTRTAYNGVAMPSFMYGTAWKKDDTARLVRQAVKCGFRAIDTANQPVHYNEVAVGEALEALAGDETPRELLFVQTKFTPLPGHGGSPPPYDPSAALGEQVAQSFASSLEHLHTGIVDSYVLHGPYSRAGLSDADREVWAAIEAIYRSERARMIGVSNIGASQLAQLCEEADVKPMVVQNRCFATLGWDRDVREVCRANDIIYQGFSLLTANQGIFADPDVRAMADKRGVGPAQVVFRFAMDVGMVPLTGTTSEDHMREDLGVARFDLTPDEIACIEDIAV